MSVSQKCQSYFDRDDVTDVEWAELLEEIKEENSEYMKGYYERLQDDDYLIPNNPYAYSYYYNYVARKGVGSAYGLTDLDGNVVDAKMVEGKYGTVWLIKKEDGSVEWVNTSVAENWDRRQAFYKKKGYVWVQLWMKVRNNGFGQYEPNPKEIVDVWVLGEEKESEEQK